MKTEKIFYRKKKDGKFYYDKEKSKLIESLLKNNKYLYYFDGKKEIKEKNIKDNVLKGFNTHNNYVFEKKLSDNISDEEAKIMGLTIKKRKSKRYIVTKINIKNKKVKDTRDIIKGIYDDKFNLVTQKILVKEYENFIELAKQYNINVDDIYYLNPGFNEATDFLDVNKDNIKTTKIKIPLKIDGFYIKKLNKQTKDIKQIIHTFISINGFNQQLFFDLYFNDIKNIHSFKKYKIYNNDELKDIWREVTFAIKNKTELSLKYIGKDITKVDYVYNYDKMLEDIQFDNIKDLSKFIKNEKLKIRRNIEKLKNEKAVLNYVKKHNNFYTNDIASLYNIDEKTVIDILKDNKIKIQNTKNDSIKNIIETSYNWFIMINLKPSIKALIEATKRHYSERIYDVAGNLIDIKDEYKYFSRNTILKYIKKDWKIYSDKEYQKSLDEYTNQLKEPIVEHKKRNTEIDDDEFDFWTMDDMNEQWKREEDEKKFDVNEEYLNFMGEIEYKRRRKIYEKELKEYEKYIEKEIKKGLKYVEFNWDEKDKEFFKKNGLDIESVYNRINEETQKKLLKELENHEKNIEYFNSLKINK